MMARTIAALQDVAEKSINAPDDGSQPDLSSGYKLDELLKSAKDIKKRFFRDYLVMQFPIENNLDCWVPAKVEKATCAALMGANFDETKFQELLAQEEPTTDAEDRDQTLETVTRDMLVDLGWLDQKIAARRFMIVYKESKRILKVNIRNNHSLTNYSMSPHFMFQVVKGKQKGTLGTLLYLVDLQTVVW